MKIIKTAKYEKLAKTDYYSGRTQLEIGISYYDGTQSDYVGFYDDTLQKPVSPELNQWLMKVVSQEDKEEDQPACSIFIDVSMTGSYTPASMYGGADHMGWAEEGDEEREIGDVSFATANMGPIPIPPEIEKVILRDYDNYIHTVNIERREQEYDGPDSYSDMI